MVSCLPTDESYTYYRHLLLPTREEHLLHLLPRKHLLPTREEGHLTEQEIYERGVRGDTLVEKKTGKSRGET